MRAAQRVSARIPLRVAVLLNAAIQSVRGVAGAQLPVGKCLALISRHFADTWKDAVPRWTPSQRHRERDGGWCTVPGCSRHSTDSHHAVLRSQGGSDDATNRTGVCGWHHHRCLHAGHLRVRGTAPGALTWERREPTGWTVWTGRPALTQR